MNDGVLQLADRHPVRRDRRDWDPQIDFAARRQRTPGGVARDVWGRQGYRTEEIAQMVGMDMSYLYKMARGERPMPVSLAAQLAKLLHAPEILEAACAVCPVGCTREDGEMAVGR